MRGSSMARVKSTRAAVEMDFGDQPVQPLADFRQRAERHIAGAGLCVGRVILKGTRKALPHPFEREREFARGGGEVEKIGLVGESIEGHRGASVDGGGI